jgi:uncharacterized protein (TIGR03435 family)
LKLCRAHLIYLTGWFAFTASLLFAQEKSARGGASAVTNLPEFEVASVRAHPSGYWPTSSSFIFTADGFHAKNVQAQYLIIYAFDLRDPGLRFKGNLLNGAPSWVQSDWYDIEAKMSEPDAAKLSLLDSKQRDARERLMLQALLVDRFKLKVSHISQDAPAYQLQVAKNGPKHMKLSAAAEPSVSTTDLENGERRTQYVAQPIDSVLFRLRGELKCPVEDKTGLNGKYDFSLDWWLDPATMPLREPGDPPPPPDPSGPIFITAVQEQLGLKLVRIIAPLESIVVDHIERASQNQPLDD